MSDKRYEIESKQLFSKSKFWQLNRDFYNEKGIRAFSEDMVPHQLTSNSFVGKTYAELIFGFLMDLAQKGRSDETVYAIELGAGHGRLAFLVLTHLQKLIEGYSMRLPSFCYILSDIVEENLSFFEEHPQLENFYRDGLLDVSFFDGLESKELSLRKAKRTIKIQELSQPLIAIANYFFDSLPNDLFWVQDKTISSCSVTLETDVPPENLSTTELIEHLDWTNEYSILEDSFFDNSLMNEILTGYKDTVKECYLFFPEKGMQCIDNLKSLSKEGLMLLSLDKGFHTLEDLGNQKEPDIVRHGSLSVWVNYHALGAYCEKQEGHAYLPSNSNFHLELATLLFLKEGKTYMHTRRAYQKYVDDFGPDDFNSIKHLSYFNVARLKLKELIALFRLSVYDPSFFIKFLPRLKQLTQTITQSDRTRIAETMHQVWAMYYSMSEPYDLAYEMGSLFYGLGYYKESLQYFEYSVQFHGQKADTYYNMALSYYQLREDKLYAETLAKGKRDFPQFEMFKQLDKLDMEA